MFGGLTGSGTSSTWSTDFRDVVREPRVDLPFIRLEITDWFLDVDGKLPVLERVRTIDVPASGCC